MSKISVLSLLMGVGLVPLIDAVYICEDICDDDDYGYTLFDAFLCKICSDEYDYEDDYEDAIRTSTEKCTDRTPSKNEPSKGKEEEKLAEGNVDASKKQPDKMEGVKEPAKKEETQNEPENKKKPEEPEKKEGGKTEGTKKE